MGLVRFRDLDRPAAGVGNARTDLRNAFVQHIGEAAQRIDGFLDLGEARVDVFGQGSNRRIAQANALGPAVVPQVSPYRPDIISVGIIGDYPYADVGPGEYQTDVGASTGHVIDVGNDVTLSGIVRFLRPDGSPLAARYGYARRPDGSQPEPIFTTSEGRAFIANLRAGTYVIEFDNGRFRASIDVPAGSEGQIDLGQVTMQEGSR